MAVFSSFSLILAKFPPSHFWPAVASHGGAAGASTKREKTPHMIMRLVREKVQKNTAFKESTLALTPQLLAGRIYIH